MTKAFKKLIHRHAIKFDNWSDHQLFNTEIEGNFIMPYNKQSYLDEKRKRLVYCLIRILYN